MGPGVRRVGEATWMLAPYRMRSRAVGTPGPSREAAVCASVAMIAASQSIFSPSTVPTRTPSKLVSTVVTVVPHRARRPSASHSHRDPIPEARHNIPSGPVNDSANERRPERGCHLVGAHSPYRFHNWANDTARRTIAHCRSAPALGLERFGAVDETVRVE